MFMHMLILGLVLFFSVHSVAIVNPGWRNQMLNRLGPVVWKGAYALVAIAGLVLVVMGYSQARLDPLFFYVPPAWTRHLTFLLLLPVFPLLLAAYLPGRIQRATKHPMLLATKVWALAHLISNGTLADVLLFGSFLLWAVADRISVKQRATISSPQLPGSRWNDLIVVGAGLALYVFFLIGGHALLIGMPLL
jgi:uncharacterized membrane protein